MSEAIVDHPIESELVNHQEVPVTDIQKKADGSFVVTRNGYPFHVTRADTADVFLQVLAEIKGGAKVIDYVEPDIKKQSPEEAASDEYNRLRGIADFTIAPLQDAVDLEEASATEIANLKAWRQYRASLSRVAGQPGYPNAIEWPVAPK